MSDVHEPGSYLKATLESQPAELARLLADDSATRAATRLRDCSRILLAGTGTSFTARLQASSSCAAPVSTHGRYGHSN